MKKIIILDDYKCEILNYKYELPLTICLCMYKRSKKTNIEQINSFTVCREILVYNFMKNIKHIDKKRLRLLISSPIDIFTTKKQAIDKIKVGCKMASIVNKHYKMQPMTYRVVRCKEKFPIIEVSASSKWQRSPQMLSLFLLFIKYCSIKTFNKVETYEQLLETINKDEYLTHELAIDSKKITIFLNNYDKLFRNLPMEVNYNTNSYNNLSQYNIQFDGISKLYNDRSMHVILKKRFDNLLPEK